MGTKCPQCLSENQDQSKFCAECGTKLPFAADSPFTRTLVAEPPLKAPAKGTVFAERYAIIGELGRGGMGVVYKAEDARLKRTVALKFLPPGLMLIPEAKERFLREAQSAAALSHPNICTIHEVEETNDQPYIAMEYVGGENLGQRTKRGPLTGDEAAAIAVQIADGLEAAHQRGIVHRDIKPANIMVTEKGQAKIMDFGLAQVAGGSRLTKEAKTVGTIAYMSPEQARGEDLDRRTDIWSFGVVLYEMLTGQLPFRGDRESIILHSIMEADPKPARLINPAIPVELQRIVDRALLKKREDRYASAAEMGRDLKRYLDSHRAEEAGFFNLKSLARRLKKPAYFIPATAVLLAFGAFAYWRIDRNAHVRWARQVAIPEIQRLYQDEKFYEALKIASRAENYIPKDPALREMLSQIAGEQAIETAPPGAAVYIREYRAEEAPWEFAGLTPLPAVRMAKGDWRLKVEKAGFEPMETWTFINEKALDKTAWGNEALKITLDRSGSLPSGMVRFEESKNARPGLTGLRGAAPVDLPPYFLDRFEVTNRQYKTFIERGGYKDPKYWKNPFIDNGRTISREDAMKLFVDRTGMPGPSGWDLGDYPQGQDDYPVSGVSWYEAAAYAEFVGKLLPSVYHWAQPLLPGTNFKTALLPLSNFEGKGPVSVGSTQALSWGGTYDQCGNVKEWCWNAKADRRMVLGGAWNEPDYMGYVAEDYGPFRRDGNIGFRCMQYSGSPEPATKAFDPIPEQPVMDFSKLAPCSDEAFEVIKGIFSYEKTALEPVIESRREYSDYAVLERVSFWDAAGRSRIIAYVFLPRRSKPPFQTVVYYPMAMAWYLESFADYPLSEVELHFKHGRAVIFPVLTGTFERKKENPRGVWVSSGLPGQEGREQLIKHIQELGRCIDYVETRPSDFRADKLAYHGTSSGAIMAPLAAALEKRIKAAVAIGGGIWPNGGKLVTGFAELDQINFLPRVKIPFLLADGRYDYGYGGINSKTFMDLLGTPAKDKFLNLYETGHVAISPKSFKDILDFLDKYLGQVE